MSLTNDPIHIQLSNINLNIVNQNNNPVLDGEIKEKASMYQDTAATGGEFDRNKMYQTILFHAQEYYNTKVKTSLENIQKTIQQKKHQAQAEANSTQIKVKSHVPKCCSSSAMNRVSTKVLAEIESEGDERIKKLQEELFSDRVAAVDLIIEDLKRSILLDFTHPEINSALHLIDFSWRKNESMFLKGHICVQAIKQSPKLQKVVFAPDHTRDDILKALSNASQVRYLHLGNRDKRLFQSGDFIAIGKSCPNVEEIDIGAECIIRFKAAEAQFGNLKKLHTSVMLSKMHLFELGSVFSTLTHIYDAAGEHSKDVTGVFTQSIANTIVMEIASHRTIA